MRDKEESVMCQKQEEIEAAWSLQYHKYSMDDDRNPIFKNRLCEAQNWRCCYCGVRMDDNNTYTMPTYEHIITQSHGGKHKYDNLVIACSNCNSVRSNKYFKEHFLALQIMEVKVFNKSR